MPDAPDGTASHELVVLDRRCHVHDAPVICPSGSVNCATTARSSCGGRPPVSATVPASSTLDTDTVAATLPVGLRGPHSEPAPSPRSYSSSRNREPQESATSAPCPIPATQMHGHPCRPTPTTTATPQSVAAEPCRCPTPSVVGVFSATVAAVGPAIEHTGAWGVASASAHAPRPTSFSANTWKTYAVLLVNSASVVSRAVAPPGTSCHDRLRLVGQIRLIIAHMIPQNRRPAIWMTAAVQVSATCSSPGSAVQILGSPRLAEDRGAGVTLGALVRAVPIGVGHTRLYLPAHILSLRRVAR